MSLATEIAGKLNYLNTQDNVAANATLPYSGYTKVSKKLDNFVFQTSSSFLNKVADKNRYVKFGDKIVDTYGPELITNGDFSNGTTGWTNATVVNSKLVKSSLTVTQALLSPNKTYKLTISIDSIVSGFQIRWSNGVYQLITINPKVGFNEVYFNTDANCNGILYIQDGIGTVLDNISVREIQTAQFTVPNVTEIVAESSGITTVQVNASDYVIQSKTSPTDHTATTFRAKQTVPIGTALTNSAYFEDRTQIGVTNQQLAYHAYNTLTNSYEGIKVETLFSDVSKDDLLDNSVWMVRNGFSKVSEFLYSKGSYLCLPVGIWQSLNNGAYHPVFNGFGTRGTNDTVLDGTWYNVNQSIITSLAKTFTNTSIHASYGTGHTDTYSPMRGNLIWNGSTNAGCRPDSKFYDIVYPDQFIDVREYAKVLNPYEVELIRTDKEENGVEETTFTYESDSTIGHTNSYVYIYNLGRSIGEYIYYHYNDGTNYIYGKGRIYEIVSTESRIKKDIVFTNMVQGNYYTIANVLLTKTIPVLSSNTKLSTDLIGNPTNYPQIMKDRLASGVGIVGINPLLVGQDGTNYSVGGTLNPIYSSKLINVFNALYTDNGTTYVSYAPTVNFIANTFGLVYSAPRILLHSYTSKNNPYIQTTPKPVVEVLPKVKASNSHSIYKGALVGNQVAGKIQVGNGSNGYESKVLEDTIMMPKIWRHNITSIMSQGFTLAGIWMVAEISGSSSRFNNTLVIINSVTAVFHENSMNGWYVGSDGYSIYDNSNNLKSYIQVYVGQKDVVWLGTTPSHSTIALDNSNSPASKWFECLEEGNNGVLAGVYGQEVVYGSDTGNFANLSNGTTTDFSNNTVRTFHGSIPLNGKIK